MLIYNLKKGVLPINFKDLTYFAYLAKTKSFTETAKHFFISQPSISMAIKRLEDHFGTQLIIRGTVNKKLELTELGEFILIRTNEILDTIDLIHIEVENYYTENATLGIPPIFGGYLLPKIMPFLEEYTDKLNLVEEPGSLSIYEQIINDKIPTAIVGSVDRKNYSNKIYQIPLLTDEFYIVVSNKHRLAKSSFVSPNLLHTENFISLGEGFAQNLVLKQWLNNNNLHSASMQFTNEIQTAKALVSSNIGVSLLVGMLIDENDSIKKIKIENAPKFHISILINKYVYINDLQKEFNKKLISLSKINLFD